MSEQVVQMNEQQPAPVKMKTTNLGLREVTLLAIGGSYAALMLDAGKIAVVLGWLAVALVIAAFVRGPRPSGTLVAVYGAGLFLMAFWWPKENWWHAAIALMWVGVALVAMGVVMRVRDRRRGAERSGLGVDS